MTDNQSNKKRHWKRRQGAAGSAGASVAPRTQHATISTNDARQGHVRSNGTKRSWESHDDGGRIHQGNRHSHQQQRSSQHTTDGPRSYPATPSRSVVPETTRSLEGSTAVAPEPSIREIPGFYFDTDKKKYFKITENHVFGNQHPFSRQSINRKQEQKIDSVEGSLYLGTMQGELWQHRLPNDPWDRHHQWMQLNTGESSEMTSLHRTPDNYLISTYLGSMGRSGVLKIHQKVQEESSRFSFSQHSLSLVFEHSPSPKSSSFWTSAYGGNKLAIGADQKAAVLRDWRSGSHDADTLWTGSDVFSLAIEPLGGQNVVYAGCRNGSVRIFDLLQPSTFALNARSKKQARSNALFPGIGHKNASVHCVRRVSDHYLVTAAMNGEISMWDTRFVKGSSSDPQAKSVLDFRGFVKDQFSSTTFDVNESETLLAADNIEQQVSLWSLSTGDRVRDLDVAGPVSCLKFAGSYRLWATGQDCVQSWGL
ncbi:DDB1- and CUL4-associated factor 4 [Mortierella alpina]|uniref:DDB1- and CUL4-associated factor 4 n=1 Tax=Mortierella alpina TaxID=64518 RepID=A0A9P6LYG3_MORAP|nr:DDB1- and CUL4-associated factor 4 [Mortierella alpina]